MKNRLLLIIILFFCYSVEAQQDKTLNFKVDNGQIEADEYLETDTAGYYDYAEDSDVGNTNCPVFEYFPWMPGYGLYLSFNVVQTNYKHTGSMYPDTLILGNYTHPAKFSITSKYGKRRRRMHYGNDIGYPYGTPVVAAFDGIVRLSKSNAGGFGELVVIRHFNKLETYYGHLSKRLVNPGQMVKSGDTIGLGGSTGRSTGNHLHFETRYLGIPFNPSKIIDFEKYALLMDTLYTNRSADVIAMTAPRPETPTSSIISNSTSSNASSHTASKPTTTKPSTGATYYTVKNGDTLSHIAQRYHTSVANLKKLNGLKSDFLSLGKKLRVK